MKAGRAATGRSLAVRWRCCSAEMALVNLRCALDACRNGLSSATWRMTWRITWRPGWYGRTARRLPQVDRQLRDTLDMRDLGIAMHRTKLRRQNPGASRAQINQLIHDWLARQDGDHAPLPQERTRVTPSRADIRRVTADLKAVKARWAFIGGMAASARETLSRFTEDMDFAVAVADDREAEFLVSGLLARGYSMAMPPIEQEYTGRMSTVRLVRNGSSAYVDLLFASSGIENEIVAAATLAEPIQGTRSPTASVAHLIALKTLAGRLKDQVDLEELIKVATPVDLDAAREAVALIQSRGFNRGKDLAGDLETAIAARAAKRHARRRGPAA